MTVHGIVSDIVRGVCMYVCGELLLFCGLAGAVETQFMRAAKTMRGSGNFVFAAFPLEHQAVAEQVYGGEAAWDRWKNKGSGECVYAVHRMRGAPDRLFSHTYDGKTSLLDRFLDEMTSDIPHPVVVGAVHAF